MSNESGTWIMHGIPEDAPGCIHTVDEAIEYIEKAGFLPLFRNSIPGFSLEEHTCTEYWWSGNREKDPWEWREIIARCGKIAYGKFFDKKAGFISKEWFPYFANHRRDGYDFDALWDDEKATRRQKKIMDHFEDEDAEILSFELKQMAGFGKEGEKNFDGTTTNLQMQTYLCMCDFRRKKNKKGQEYGMDVAVYSKPEHIWGYDHVTSAYKEDVLESAKKIAMHMMVLYPEATADQIRKVIGAGPDEAVKTTNNQKKKSVDYPANIFRELNTGINVPTADQLFGLEFVLGQLKDECQEIMQMRFEQGMTYKQIGELTGRSGSRCSQICKKGIKQLINPLRMVWYIQGYQGRLDQLMEKVDIAKMQFLAEGRTKEAEMLYMVPEALQDISAKTGGILMKAGIINLGILREIMKEENGIGFMSGIGTRTVAMIVKTMLKEGLIDDSFPCVDKLKS